MFHSWKLHKTWDIKNQKVWFCLLFKKHQTTHQKPVIFLGCFSKKKTCVFIVGFFHFNSKNKEEVSWMKPPEALDPPSTRSQAPMEAVHINRYHEAWWDLAIANWSLKKLGWSQMSLHQSSFPDLVKVCAFFWCSQLDSWILTQKFCWSNFFIDQFSATETSPNNWKGKSLSLPGSRKNLPNLGVMANQARWSQLVTTVASRRCLVSSLLLGGNKAIHRCVLHVVILLMVQKSQGQPPFGCIPNSSYCK